MPAMKAPSQYPNAAAAKYPMLESRATVPVGLGIFVSAPTALSAIKIDMRATRRWVKNTLRGRAEELCSVPGGIDKRCLLLLVSFEFDVKLTAVAAEKGSHQFNDAASFDVRMSLQKDERVPGGNAQ